MKRKLPLLMAMLLLVSVLCAPVAQAAYAPSPGGGEIEIDDPDVPLVDVPEIRIPVESDGIVPEDELLEAAAQVAEGEAVRITIYPKDGASVSQVQLSAEGLKAVQEAGAELKVETSAGKAVFSAASLAGFNGDVILVIEKEVEELKAFGRDLGLKVYVLCGGTVYYSWTGDPITLYVPAVNGDYEAGSIYSVEQLNENGKEIRTYEGQCVEEDGELWVVITVDSNYLGYFVTLPGAVADTVTVADPTIVASPLISRTTANDKAPSLLASVQHWFDSVAGQIMQLFGL